MTTTAHAIARRLGPTTRLTSSVIGAALAFIVSDLGVVHASPVFGPPAPLNTTATNPLGSSDGPAQIVSDGAGTWVATWHANDGTGDKIVTARSSDDGLSWSAPLPHVAHRSLQGPHLATDKAGTWILVGEGGDVIRSTDNGLTWSDPIPHPVRVSNDARDTSIATNGLGTWIAGIARDTNDRAGIARSVDAGLTWGTPLFLNPDAPDGSQHSTVPEVVSLGGSVWLAVWGTSETLGGTIGTDWDVVYSRSTDDGVTWTAAAPLSSTALTDGASDHDATPLAATDGSGNVVVVWRSSPDFGGIGSDADILVVRSSDSGASWSAAAPLNSDAASDTDNDLGPVVATDGNGTWLTVWFAYGAGTSSIKLAQSTDDGATWSGPTTLDTSSQTLWAPLIAHGGTQWLAAWNSSDTHGVLAGGPHLLVSLADHPCGNGSIDAGETCDDGNRLPSDCCAGTCTFEPATTACARDGDVCTFDRCNATGVCEHVLEPQLNCRPPAAAGKSTLQLKAGSKPGLQWKTAAAARPLWEFNGFTFFSNGLSIVPDIAMCVYDSTGLVARATPQGSVLCGSKPCWTSGRAIRYFDHAATADGLARIDIQRSGDKGKTLVQGRGATLPLPPLPVVNLPLTVQLGTADGGCWSATYSNPKKNTGVQFKAKSD